MGRRVAVGRVLGLGSARRSNGKRERDVEMEGGEGGGGGGRKSEEARDTQA